MAATTEPAPPPAGQGRGRADSFPALVIGGLTLLVGVTLVSLWRVPGLVAQVVHICQAGWATPQMAEHVPAVAALFVPAILVVGLVRGTVSLIRQGWLTRRHLRRLEALTGPAPTRLRALAEAVGIGERITFIASDRTFAFCGGLRRPQVWVSAGLLERLDDEELTAVLRHEAHHLRRRDPLRRLVVRALRDALFFLPLARDLSEWYEVEQEINADRAVGEVLPLASALHKLLTSSAAHSMPDPVVLSGLNVTEARVRHLLRAEPPRRETWRRPSLVASLVVGLVMLGLMLASAWTLTPHLHLGIGACQAEHWLSIPATLIP